MKNDAISTPTSQTLFTVTRLNSEVRLLLETQMGIVWLIGELSNFSMPVSGHWYFSLKDKQSQVKCAMFRGNNRQVSFKPSNGNQVLVRARISLYEPRGGYQLIIDSMHPEGDGLLQQQFEATKQKLAAEGLFASSGKKPLPAHPKTLGIITSQTGAALYDILQVLKRRDPRLRVIIYPTLVQGKEAANQIAQAIECANTRAECEVLIVGRGGGSLEDLWCFNEESVARAIAASQIPIISAVGHEVDVTISDLVADLRAPTPSAAAELVSRDRSYDDNQLRALVQKLHSAYRHQHHKAQLQLTQLQQLLAHHHPQARLARQHQQLDELTYALEKAIKLYITRHQQQITAYQQRTSVHKIAAQLAHAQHQLAQQQRRLETAIEQQLHRHAHRLQNIISTLDAVSPLATLARGYSLTTNAQGAPIRSVSQLAAGDKITTRLPDGTLHATVDAITLD